MHMIFRSAIVALTLILASMSAASAESEHLTLRGGLFDFDDDMEAATFGVEYRGMPFWHDMRPIGGIEINEDSGGYIYAGVAYDWQICERFIISPNFAVAGYEEGDGRDLGGTVQFRSGIELDYAFYNDHRIGVALHHISNAGIYDHNPGTETVTVNYSVPMQIFK